MVEDDLLLVHGLVVEVLLDLGLLLHALILVLRWVHHYHWFFLDHLRGSIFDRLILLGDVGVLGEDLLAGHAQALEQKVGLDRGNHVFFFLRDQVAGLQLEIFLVNSLGLFDVVAEGLLLDAGAVHFLLVLGKVVVGDLGLGVISLALFLLLLDLLCVS